MEPPVITSSLLTSSGIVQSGVSTRLGGVSSPPFGMNLSLKVGDEPSNVEENRRRFLSVFGTASERLATPIQVHGNVVQRVSTPGQYPDCDGLVTDVPGLFLGVSVADCVPVLMLDRRRRVIAAVHAGWRGSSSGIAQQAIGVMRAEFDSDPVDITVFIGPCASACCYSVGKEVADVFDLSVVTKRDGIYFVDLKAAINLALASSGVPANQIEMSQHCTISDSDLFHSFRRDKEKSGRMMAVIGMTVPR